MIWHHSQQTTFQQHRGNNLTEQCLKTYQRCTLSIQSHPHQSNILQGKLHILFGQYGPCTFPLRSLSTCLLYSQHLSSLSNIMNILRSQSRSIFLQRIPDTAEVILAGCFLCCRCQQCKKYTPQIAQVSISLQGSHCMSQKEISSIFLQYRDDM